MALRMPSPSKHPKTGVYYLTVRVPSEIVKAGVRPVVKESLRTKDPAEAKRRFSLRYEELQRERQAVRSGPAMVPFMQLVALAGQWRRELDAMVEREPGEALMWETLKAKALAADGAHQSLARWYGADADRLLRSAGLNANDYSRQRLIGQLHLVMKEWAEFQRRRSHGDFRPDPPDTLGQLQEMGLVEMIKQLSRGPIFLTAGGDPAAKARGASGKVGKWVREVVKIEDPRVQPNHAWRHRFKTVARDVDIAPEYVDAIQGREDGRASSDYGETTIRALWREIKKLPVVNIPDAV